MNRAPHQILSEAACITAFVSTAIHGGYACIFHKLPIYLVENGICFTLGMNAWRVIGFALTFGTLGAACLVISCLIHRHRLLSPLNIATLLLLIPAAYTTRCLILLLRY